jgi:hypothetical protein
MSKAAREIDRAGGPDVPVALERAEAAGAIDALRIVQSALNDHVRDEHGGTYIFGCERCQALEDRMVSILREAGALTAGSRWSP